MKLKKVSMNTIQQRAETSAEKQEALTGTSSSEKDKVIQSLKRENKQKDEKIRALEAKLQEMQ